MPFQTIVGSLRAPMSSTVLFVLLQIAEVADDSEALEQLLVQAQVNTQGELAKLISDTKQKVERYGIGD